MLVLHYSVAANTGNKEINKCIQGFQSLGRTCFFVCDAWQTIQTHPELHSGLTETLLFLLQRNFGLKLLFYIVMSFPVPALPFFFVFKLAVNYI